ncbi:MAG: hypothetical protein MJY71_08125 [Bacteroidaceae bacterium]|nr:hypothetical protein [Bacteroidaceae bacterium]
MEEIKQMASAGCTNKEIADALGISVSSFCEYLNSYSEFSEAVKNARIKGVAEVRQALFKKAVGFDYEEKKRLIRKDENGKDVITVEITQKKALPDSNAIQMYLRNYDPEWKDKDAISYKFKEMELELRKQSLEESEW